MNKFKFFLKVLFGPKSIKKIAIVISRIEFIIYHLTDILFSPLTILFTYYFREMRRRQFIGLPISKRILFSIGVLPIIDHYYEPMFNHKKHLRNSLRKKRYLPGIDLNIKTQIELLRNFKYNDELLKIPLEKENDEIVFCFNEGPFPSADAEYLYNIIRFFQPKQIIEIGSGHSTLMAANAINQNRKQNSKYACQHICIEPYENTWLDKLGIHVIREKVENCDISLFKKLKANDILFIDSSHIIRPQGDVLYEYLEIMPQLKSGVLIHLHDIFTPEDYPAEWVFYGNRLWNEQYLLEAFLTCNNDFSVIGSTNFLLYNNFKEFSSVCPITKTFIEKGKQVGAGSFWLKKK